MTLHHTHLSRPLFEEHHLVLLAEPGEPSQPALHRLLSQTAAVLREHAAEALILRVHGPLGGAAHAIRAALSAGLGARLAYVAGREPALVSVQAWAFTPRHPELRVRSLGPGRVLEGPELLLAYLPAITGLDDRGHLGAGPAQQTRLALERARSELESLGLSYRDVHRTWLYLRDILSWYDQLNTVRSRFHQQVGLTGPPTLAPFPASTGIEGTRDGEWLALEVLAGRVSTIPIHATARQRSSWEYGSAFSRGMALDWSPGQTVLVSGTASIDSEGRTLHTGDLRAQIRETVACVRAVLQTRGMDLEHLASGALYLAEPQFLAAWEEEWRRLQIPPLPLVPVIGRVCRDDLLVEIEAIGAMPVTDLDCVG